jgi:hypothetical protein
MNIQNQERCSFCGCKLGLHKFRINDDFEICPDCFFDIDEIEEGIAVEEIGSIYEEIDALSLDLPFDLSDDGIEKHFRDIPF